MDGRAAGASGIGRYLTHVLRGIVADPRLRPVTVAGDPDRIRSLLNGTDGVELLPFPAGFYRAGHQLRWGRALRGRPRDEVAFFPHYDVPWRLPRVSVVTVHDLTHFLLSELFPAPRLLAAGALMRRVVARAGTIVVPSAATRDDLVRLFGAQPDRVRVAFEGVDSGFWTPAPPGNPRPLDMPFLLSVGNRKPHKNHQFAVEVLAAFGDRHPQLRLVVLGRRDRADDGVGERAASLGVDDRVHEVTDATDAELRTWYRHAEALLLPSRYEGFGLPALEAMACGTPVVASDRGALPEVVGEVGIVLPPDDPGPWTEECARILTDTEHAGRLREAGRARAEGLGWERAARTVADLLATARVR